MGSVRVVGIECGFGDWCMLCAEDGCVDWDDKECAQCVWTS